jgi:hypothetical protein
MYLCVSGFLLNGAEDDSLKFELNVDRSYNEQIAHLLGHESVKATAEPEWFLNSEQTSKLSQLIR